MKVCPAETGTPDPHDDIMRTGNLRIGDFLDRRAFAVGVQANSFHGYFLCKV
jgi:hypothetical protein